MRRKRRTQRRPFPALASTIASITALARRLLRAQRAPLARLRNRDGERPQTLYRFHVGRRGVLHYRGHDVEPARCSTSATTSGGDCASRSATCYPCEAARSSLKATKRSNRSAALVIDNLPVAVTDQLYKSPDQ
jgi:hypothetical protein